MHEYTWVSVHFMLNYCVRNSANRTTYGVPMAFLKFICKADSTHSPDWTADPVRRYRSASVTEKARFCLEQSIILSYLDYLYGKNGPILLKQYRDFFIRWYISDLQEIANTDTTNIRPVYIACATLLGIIPGKIDSNEVFKYLTDEKIDCPKAVEKSFYEPYLKFKENVSDLRQYVENEQMNKVRSFTIANTCTIPSFKLSGKLIIVNYEIEFSSYSFSYSNLKDMLEDMLEVDTIFSYLAGYKWSGKNVTGVFGVLASQCMTYDPNDLDFESPMLGFVEIYKKITNSYFKPENNKALHDALIKQRRKIVRFCIYLRKHHRIVFDDINTLADYADSIDTDDNHPLRQYFVSLSKEISTEVYMAFRNSQFAKFEELDKLRRGYRDAADDRTDNRAGNSGSDEKEDPQGGSAPNSESQGTEDELKGLESPTGIQDSSKEDNSTDQSTPDSDTEAEPNSEQKQDPEEETQNELPDLPRVSDKSGVKLKLSAGESTDTVLYREELRAYIDSLLQNPPRNFSVQTVAALKRIKANWLYLLDVECLYKFMSALIKMPKSLKVKPPKKDDK